MTDSYANEFRELLNQIDNFDLANGPNMIVTKAFFERLMAIGFAEMEASELIPCVDIEVNQEFIDEGLVDETVNVFANLLLRMKKEYNKISPFLFNKVVKQKGLSIKYR
jgi:hypothetical protein